MSKPRILYAEDDPTLRFITSENLERKGYKVLECEDGRSGLECFKTEDPDLCILDVMMPGIDGFTLDSGNLLLMHPSGDQVLTQREADLLSFFVRNKNRLVSRELILEALWGENDYFFGRSLDVFISKLRKYLKADEKIKIENRHGIGFVLKE